MFKLPWSKPEQDKSFQKAEAALTLVLLRHKSGSYTTDEAIKIIYRWFHK